jgi:hypothetical protein
LAARQHRWCLRYEGFDDERDDDPFDICQFAAEGLAIAQAIKAELPDWTVIYFDIEKCKFDDSDQPRSDFEYEVT